jgi:MFS family permease
VRLTDSLAVLREREFRLLFTGQLISLLGDAFSTVALAFAVLDLMPSTGNATSALGIVLAARTIPLVGFLLAGGVIADRLSRRRVMLAADVVRMGTYAATAALVLGHSATVAELAALQAISGTATAFFNPASTGLTPIVVSPQGLQQANALRGISLSATSLAGLVAGGAVVALVGPGWALAVDAASFGASVVFLALLRLPAHVPLPPQSFLADLREGWHEFVSRTWVWTIVLAASATNALNSVFAVLLAVIAKRDLGGASVYTTILAGLAVGALLGGALTLRVRPRRPLLFGTGLLACIALPVALLALRAPVPMIALGAVVSGCTNMLFNALWETALQRHVPVAALSRVSAYDWFGSLAFQPLGFLLAAPLAAALGENTTLWVVAAGSVGVVLLALVPQSVRNLTALPRAEVVPLGGTTSN